jgi:ribosomal protein S18 acetylase RimI-like enzyme
MLNAYAQDPMGLAEPLPSELQSRVVDGLRDHSTSHQYVAYANGRPVGLAVCFQGYSTFSAKPLVNIHDLIVHPQARRRGVASALLAAVEAEARQLQCCKLTLEVRKDNTAAKALYGRSGFGPGDPPHEFWSKLLKS